MSPDEYMMILGGYHDTGERTQNGYPYWANDNGDRFIYWGNGRLQGKDEKGHWKPFTVKDYITSISNTKV